MLVSDLDALRSAFDLERILPGRVETLPVLSNVEIRLSPTDGFAALCARSSCSRPHLPGDGGLPESLDPQLSG